jgi:hypothetical protein
MASVVCHLPPAFCQHSAGDGVASLRVMAGRLELLTSPSPALSLLSLSAVLVP